MQSLDHLAIKLFADGAELDSISKLAANPLIRGFTTNPTLMRKAGVTDYAAFAKEILALVPGLPVSFEVLADDLPTMEAQALKIASWGPNVNVKIPVTTSDGTSTAALVHSLSSQGVQVNVTAIFTRDQVREVIEALSIDTPAIISVFAGRVADCGIDPVPLMSDCAAMIKSKPKTELLWASPRELFNIFQADSTGCHIITVGHDLLAKLALIGKDQLAFSRETVEMFVKDAAAAGFTIDIDQSAAA